MIEIGPARGPWQLAARLREEEPAEVIERPEAGEATGFAGPAALRAAGGRARAGFEPLPPSLSPPPRRGCRRLAGRCTAFLRRVAAYRACESAACGLARAA